MKTAVSKLFKNNFVIMAVLVIVFWSLLKKWLAGANVFQFDKSTNGTVYTKAQATQIAEQLYQAMTDAGTDEDTVFGLLDPMSLSDYNMVFNQFGKRDYIDIPHEITSTPRNMTFWITHELSESELSDLNQRNPELALGFPEYE